MKADLSGVTAAASAYARDIAKDVRVSITNAPGKSAYPICSFTYLLIPDKIGDAGKREAIKGFLKWMATTGQSDTEKLSYAKLPKAVVDLEMKQLAKIQ
jgi:phosphate transport system substrate-binding protein